MRAETTRFFVAPPNGRVLSVMIPASQLPNLEPFAASRVGLPQP